MLNAFKLIDGFTSITMSLFEYKNTIRICANVL